MGSSDSDHLPPPQGHLLFQRLLGLKSRRVKLKIASSLNDCAELKALAAHGELVCHIFNLQKGGKINPKAIGYATVVGKIKMYSGKHVTCFLFSSSAEALQTFRVRPRFFFCFFFIVQQCNQSHGFTLWVSIFLFVLAESDC